MGENLEKRSDGPLGLSENWWKEEKFQEPLQDRVLNDLVSDKINLDEPLPKGTKILFFSGTATGHGELRAGEAMLDGKADISGMVPRNIRISKSNWMSPMVISDGERNIQITYVDQSHGGWTEIEVPKN